MLPTRARCSYPSLFLYFFRTIIKSITYQLCGILLHSSSHRHASRHIRGNNIPGDGCHPQCSALLFDCSVLHFVRLSYTLSLAHSLSCCHQPLSFLSLFLKLLSPLPSLLLLFFFSLPFPPIRFFSLPFLSIVFLLLTSLLYPCIRFFSETRGPL